MVGSRRIGLRDRHKVRMTLTAALALACASSAAAFSVSPLPASSSSLPGHPRRLLSSPRKSLQLGQLRAQLRPEDERQRGKGQSAFQGDGAWQDFVAAAREGWSRGEGERERGSAALPNLFLVPVWVGVAAMGLFLPAPQMLESVFMGMGHGVEVANAADLTMAFQGVQAAAAKAAASAPPVSGMTTGGLDLNQLGSLNLDPSTFVPVCQFSDGFYRTAQSLVFKAAGREVYQEYSPLIAGSLLRVRLEFCVLESFVYESIIPFVKARGLSWVFPLKETLETFIAGTVFAVATNLVLIGSTKIITIVVSYADFFLGFPIRLVFGFTADRLKGAGAEKNVLAPLYYGTTALKSVGQVSLGVRKFVEGADVFVGRYLLLTTVGYVGLKFLKFKGVLTLENLGAFFNGAADVVVNVGSVASKVGSVALLTQTTH